MSPVGDNFRNYIRMFPSLVSCTTIDWFSEWPEDALLEVADKFLEEVPDTSSAVSGGMCMWTCDRRFLFFVFLFFHITAFDCTNRSASPLARCSSVSTLQSRR